MKNKRSKNSIFYDSTKKKRRKQEKGMNFYKQNKNNHPKSNDMPFPSQNIPNKNGMNSFFINPNDTTYNKASLRHQVSPIISDGSFSDLSGDSSISGSGHSYKRKEEKRVYLYGFTDSKFIYFLGKLDPRSYLIFVTLIALLILEDLNETESKIIFAFLSNVSDAMQTIVEQEVILNSYHLKVFQRDQGAALQNDFDTLYSQINQLKREVRQLKN